MEWQIEMMNLLSVALLAQLATPAQQVLPVLSFPEPGLDDSVAYLPPRAAEEPLPGGGVRAAPKVRPNELCPCGSGKKYKRCHGA